MRFFVLATILTAAAMVQAAPVDKRNSVATQDETHNVVVAQGQARDSPGVLTGNTVIVPVVVPVNACGNSFDLTGLIDGATASWLWHV
ncbi:hypothetical protein BGZ92_004716 [Podila epicladia]|nr:hypothetical protein BGZ92_004716 [Podila epicladia]